MENSPNPPPLWPWWLRVVIRVIFVVVGYALWQWTQALVGSRPEPPGEIGDHVLDTLAGLHHYLTEHPGAADWLLIVSSAVIDVLGLFLLGMSIFGPTMRPFLGLLLVFAMRQICMGLCTLRPPPMMIWHDPGVPSVLVTYAVANDFFFSGHTALAVLGAVEVVRFGGRRWLPLGLAIILFEATAILVLRAHYFMDVFTGAIAAGYASVLAARWAPWFDALLSGARRIAGG